MPPHASDSAVQRQSELLIIAEVAVKVGRPLSSKTIALPGGATVQVDGVDDDETVFVEAFARQGALKGGQKHKVCQDALKLITIGRRRPEARLILAFADDAAAKYARGGTWVAEALADWNVEVLVVDLSAADRAAIRAVQAAQLMRNAEPPTTQTDENHA